MKKTLSFFTLLAAFAFANAQISAVYNGSQVINDDTVTVAVYSPDDALEFPVFLENAGSEPVSCQVVADSTDPNIRITGMCAGECMIGWSTPVFVIEADSSYDGFHALMDVAEGLPAGYTAKIKFTIYEGPSVSTQFWAKFVVQSSSVHSAQQASMQLYPNPAKNFVTLSVQNARLSASAKAQVIDATGAVVLESAAVSEQIHINISMLPAGVYACRIADGPTTVAVRKLVVK